MYCQTVKHYKKTRCVIRFPDLHPKTLVNNKQCNECMQFGKNVYENEYYYSLRHYLGNAKPEG